MLKNINMPKKLLLFILISYFLLLLSGLTSELCLGDEVHHYRFAKLIYQTGKRVAQDPLYEKFMQPRYLFVDGPLWHILLAILWKLTGGISFYIAQIYHSIYYILLIYFIYLLAKMMYGEKEGIYSVIILATVPMIVSFSIIFYIDLPLTTFTVLCFLLIAQKKYFFGGIILGLMYLTKINANFFIPAFIFIIFYINKSKPVEKIRNLFLFFIPAVFFIIYDIYWRYNSLPSSLLGGSKGINGILIRIAKKRPEGITLYTTSSLINPLDIISYIGIILLFLLFLYLLYKKYEKKDIFLLAPTLSYLLCYAVLFDFGSDARYIMPVIPFLAILTSKSIVSNKKWLQVLFFTICIIQFSITCFYVGIKRKIPKGIKEGFSYIKQNIPQEALIFYPEENLIEATNRRITIWTDIINYRNLFWPKDNEEASYNIKLNKIDYIAIKKSRIYDDSKILYYGYGYPKSFVNKIEKFPFAELVFNNSQISIWKIK